MTQEEIAVKLKETDDRSRSNERRIEGLERDQLALNQLATSVAVMAQEQQTIRRDVAKSGEDIKAVRKSIEALQAAPGKRWEKVVEKIILVAVGAVVAWLLARMGIK